MTLKTIFENSDDFSRRGFLGGAARSFLGLSAMPWLSRFASAQDQDSIVLGPASARNVIYLFMRGGLSHVDTFDTKPGRDVQGPTETINTRADGVRISQHFPNLAEHMNKVCVINSMFSNQGAHAQGQYFMHTGYTMRGSIKHPSLGSWYTRMAGKSNPTLPGHVAIGNSNFISAGFMETEFGPLPIGDPSSGLQNSRPARGVSVEDFDKRMVRLGALNEAFSSKYDQKQVRAYDEMYDAAVRLMRSRDLAAFDISKESADIRSAYGNNSFGQGCLLARRLIEHKVRFVEVASDGWDTHNENFDRLGDKCPAIDQALSMLLADLEARGLLDETLVVLGTEFGRSPKINPDRNGRNHHPKAFSCLLAGGGIKGGMTWGRTDENGNDVIENKVTVPDFNATIAHALGLPLEHKLYSPSGRPFTVADKGKPVLDLFA